MRKKSPTLVCRLSMSLTTKTLEHVVLAYNLPRGPAVDRGKVAEAPQMTAQAEVPHAALPAGAGRVHNSAVRCCGACYGERIELVFGPMHPRHRQLTRAELQLLLKENDGLRTEIVRLRREAENRKGAVGSLE